MSNLANVVQQLRKERDQAQRRIEQLDEAMKVLGSLEGLRGRVGRAQTTGKRRRTMSAGGAQANCSGPACALGEMESSQAKQISEDDGYWCDNRRYRQIIRGVIGESSKSEESSAPFATLIFHVRTLSACGKGAIPEKPLRSR